MKIYPIVFCSLAILTSATQADPRSHLAGAPPVLVVGSTEGPMPYPGAGDVQSFCNYWVALWGYAYKISLSPAGTAPCPRLAFEFSGKPRLNRAIKGFAAVLDTDAANFDSTGYGIRTCQYWLMLNNAKQSLYLRAAEKIPCPISFFTPGANDKD